MPRLLLSFPLCRLCRAGTPKSLTSTPDQQHFNSQHNKTDKEFGGVRYLSSASMNRISEDIKSELITSLPPKPRTGKRWGWISQREKKMFKNKATVTSRTTGNTGHLGMLKIPTGYNLHLLEKTKKRQEKVMNRINLKSTFVLVFSKSSVICTFRELSNRSCIKNTFQILFNTFLKNISLLTKHICRNFSSRSVEVDLLCGFKWVLGN